MAEAITLERIRQKREERMRLGQMTAEVLPIPSNQEIRVALVPLLESEYDECIRAAANVDVPDNVAGASVMDRQERREVVCRSLREVGDYSKHVFSDTAMMMEHLEPPDVNFFYDAYVQMQLEISPSLDTLSEEEIDFLKDVFATIQWSDLSGKQVYALSRFLSNLAPEQLMVKLPGRLSTRS